jgi:hypothetical protein
VIEAVVAAAGDGLSDQKRKVSTQHQVLDGVV